MMAFVANRQRVVNSSKICSEPWFYQVNKKVIKIRVVLHERFFTGFVVARRSQCLPAMTFFGIQVQSLAFNSGCHDDLGYQLNAILRGIRKRFGSDNKRKLFGFRYDVGFRNDLARHMLQSLIRSTISIVVPRSHSFFVYSLAPVPYL